MNQSFDVIIIGLGAHGSSAAWHLSKAGLSVCGIDRYTPPHTHGSSHGQSRIIRTAYYEHPLYVPLIKKAFTHWREIENVSGERLLIDTGALMIGQPDAAVIKGSLLSANTHDLAVEFLHEDKLRERFPALNIPCKTVATLEKDAGILFPEKCISAFLNEAKKAGAVLHYDEKVTGINAGDRGVDVITDRGHYLAERLIVAAGAWVQELLPELHLPLTIERQVLFWFRNADSTSNAFFTPERLPVYIWEYAPDKMFYGFPDLGDGIKIAYHHSGANIRPDDLTNDTRPDEIADMARIVKQYFHIDPVLNYSTVCMYTNTTDQHFILDTHPLHKNIIVASPCSGHGFKFASITGHILADMVQNHTPAFDLSPFSLSRFQK